MSGRPGRGIHSEGLTLALRQRFGDGREHKVSEVVRVLGPMIPPEIVARRYLHHHKNASWPPPSDQRAFVTYDGQRMVILDTLRHLGAIPRSRVGPRHQIETFVLVSGSKPRLSRAEQRQQKAIARLLLERFPEQSNRTVAEITGLAHSTIWQVRRDIEAGVLAPAGPAPSEAAAPEPPLPLADRIRWAQELFTDRPERAYEEVAATCGIDLPVARNLREGIQKARKLR